MSETLHWESVLKPHRSLPNQGFKVLMAVLFVVSLGSSILFVRIGAWPVCGFFGLDVLGVYLAFRLSYRSGRMRETLRLIGDRFTVDRTGIRGERKHWSFQAFWLRVRLIERDKDANRLLLTSHGRSLPVAVFLSPDERRVLAEEVKGALTRWRGYPV